jgi:hypothetical protein
MAGRKDWGRLGAYVTRWRFKRGYEDIRALSTATGIHERTLGKLENGHPVGRNTLTAVEIAINWGPQSCELVLAGGEPIDLGPLPEGQQLASGPELRDDIERKLWAITELTEDDRWTYIDLHRARQQRGKSNSNSTRTA